MLVLLPFLLEFTAWRSWQLPQGFVVFPCDTTLRRCERGPRLHALLQALLFTRFHFWITIGNSYPFFAARIV